MKYLEINKKMESFYSISLKDILSKIQPVIANYIWSIQLIEGVGNIEGVLGMSIVDLEKYCDESEKGLILEFATLLDLSEACTDIVDVLIVACDTEEELPKAYKDENWEKKCKVIISREDSSLWKLYSERSIIMHEFEKIII